jgi:hypothetical protein
MHTAVESVWFTIPLKFPYSISPGIRLTKELISSPILEFTLIFKNSVRATGEASPSELSLPSA